MSSYTIMKREVYRS